MTERFFVCRVLIYLVAIVWGAIQAWNYRFELFFGDSQAYFDMANYYSQGQFDKAVSLYWSPLYPMIAGAMFKVFPPDPYWQFFQFKFVNLVFLVLTFFSFEYFFAQFYRYYTEVIVAADPERTTVGKNVLLLTGYALLIMFSLAFGGVHQDTPDMVNASLFFLAGGFLLKMLVAPTHKDACLFGIVLGLGYLCKAIMFCMSAIYLGLNFLFKRNIKGLVLSLACMAVFAIPWIWTLSNYLGVLTFGESAKFVYINLVEEKDPLTVEGLKHPPRVIHEKPLIREYATPVPGTVPFLYDLGYWTYGAKVHVRFYDLVKVIVSDFFYYLHTFLYIPIFVVGMVAIRSRCWPLPLKSWKVTAPIWFPPAALCAQYALVNNIYMIPYIDRYFIAAYPIMMLSTLAAIRVPADKNPALLKNACVVTTVLCLVIAGSTRLVYDIQQLFVEKQNAWYSIAQTLAENGVKPGDTVAQLGGRLHRNTQYTEPNKIRLVASIYDEALFWDLPPEKQQEVFDCLRKIGVRGVVYVRIPDMEDPMITRDLKLLCSVTGMQVKMPFKEFPPPKDLTGWKPVPGVDAYYYPF